MARKKKQETPINTDGWMNTYSDMVTLLLCFFVMMYTASTPDEAKMQWVLQSFSNLTGDIVNPVHVDDPTHPSVDDDEENPGPDMANASEGSRPGVPGKMPRTYDDLFNWVSNAIDSSELNSSVSVEMADGKLHIRFDSDVMFNADSYELLPAGRNMLNTISGGIKAINQYIDSVEVEGHTAPVQGSGGINDWTLSAMRSVSVINHLDFNRRMVNSDKFHLSGFAQYKPYYPTDTEATNAKNRRVELVITRNDFIPDNTPVMVDLLEFDYGLAPFPGESRKHTPAEVDRMKQIEARILEKHGAVKEPEKGSDEKPTGEFGPAIPKLPSISADGSLIGAPSGGSTESDGGETGDVKGSQNSAASSQKSQ